MASINKHHILAVFFIILRRRRRENRKNEKKRICVKIMIENRLGLVAFSTTYLLAKEFELIFLNCDRKFLFVS